VFFSRSRSAASRETIRLTSLGMDIGSTTTHLVISRLAVERRGSHSSVTARSVLHRSPVMLTPHLADGTLDAAALRRFVDDVYARAVLHPDGIDTGALVLTGFASQRVNAQALAAALSFEMGRFVAVAAGDALEARLAAHGAGAVARSAGCVVLHVDIGGATAKIARSVGGVIVDITAVDVGARVAGAPEVMAAQLVGAMRLADGPPVSHRLAPVPPGPAPDVVSVSGGVAEYMFGRETRDFGDQGQALAQAVLAALVRAGHAPVRLDEGLRATVLGAAQHSAQLSGSTVHVSDPALLPLHGLAVIAPDFDFSGAHIDPDAVALALRRALVPGPVAIFYRWQGPAGFARIDAFCRGLVQVAGTPLVLVGDSDIGGLVGAHLSESGLAGTVVSLDGLRLSPLDWLDIGEMLGTTGVVPVVVTSLIFGAPACHTERRAGSGKNVLL
jgi:ethanolamine utilization protein EutA